MPVQRNAVGFAFLCILLQLTQCVAEEPSSGCVCGCGFGFEVLLAKLEKIEERLDALQKWQGGIPAMSADLERTEKSELVPSTSTAPDSAVSSAFRPGGIIVPVKSEHKLNPIGGEQKVNLPIGVDPTPEQRQYGEDNIYSSCREVPSKVTGKYLIRVRDDANPVNLLCDMQTFDVGWIVVQQRFNGSERFYRGWNDYRDGFGNLDGEFWLGLERVSALVGNGQRWEIAFWLKNYAQQIRISRFDNFLLGNATDGYKLWRVGKYSGNGGDSISTHVGMKFTTYDQDNDPAAYNCAKKHRGGWWYHKTCITSNLNGDYVSAASDQANNWRSMAGTQGLLATKIMIRDVV